MEMNATKTVYIYTHTHCSHLQTHAHTQEHIDTQMERNEKREQDIVHVKWHLLQPKSKNIYVIYEQCYYMVEWWNTNHMRTVR